MSFDTSALISSFVEDCREHLDSIEASLMDIEAAGAHQNPELVNSVFRLAHSIKGGAGMLGLDNIKTLAHKLENVLHMVRSDELFPSHEVVDVLLKGFDRLTHLVDNIEDSENIAIDDQVTRLLALTEGPDGVPAAQQAQANFQLGAMSVFTVDALSLEQARHGGNELYLLEYDLIHDIHGKGRMPLDVLKTLTDTGRIVDCKLDFAAVGDLDAFGNSIPFYILYATILEPGYVAGLVKLPPERVRHIKDIASALVAPAPSAPVSDAPAQAAAPAATDPVRRFGSIALEGGNGHGIIRLPGDMGEAGQADLSSALRAALEDCQELMLDFSGVQRCDLFFLQMLLSARKSFAKRGKALGAIGGLDGELDRARAMQGFAPLL